MEEQRKRAYRFLLYQAMLEIRPITWISLGFLNPLGWRRTAARIRRAGVIADWMHNLALFSALDFERFEEVWFWKEFRYFQDKHPDFDLTQFKDAFERELADTGTIDSK